MELIVSQVSKFHVGLHAFKIVKSLKLKPCL